MLDFLHLFFVFVSPPRHGGFESHRHRPDHQRALKWARVRGRTTDTNEIQIPVRPTDDAFARDKASEVTNSLGWCPLLIACRHRWDLPHCNTQPFLCFVCPFPLLPCASKRKTEHSNKLATRKIHPTLHHAQPTVFNLKKKKKTQPNVTEKSYKYSPTWLII